MTYGDVNRDVRAAVAELFDYRRITYYLGARGNGKLPARGTVAQAQASADLIQRYRAIVWTYAHRVVQTALPPGASAPVWEPPLRLAARINETAPTTDLLPGGRVANLHELASLQPVELVEIWRRAAAAAVAGLDRELPALVSQLQRPHRHILTKDAAELTLALIRLDDRYRFAPGWRHLGDRKGPSELGHTRNIGHKHPATGLLSTALATTQWASQRITEDAYAVDQLGWRPRPTLNESASTDPAERAIDALHNTAVHLGREFPRALALRGLSRLSRLTSLHAARLAEVAGASVAKQAFDERARTYAALNCILRTPIGGNLGRGDHALAQATIALDHLTHAQIATPEQVNRLLDVSNEIDTGIATRLQQGIDDHRYFLANGRHLAATTDGGIYRSVAEYSNITGATWSELLTLRRVLERVPSGPLVELNLVGDRARLAELLTPLTEPTRRSMYPSAQRLTAPSTTDPGVLAPMGPKSSGHGVPPYTATEPAIVL